MAQHRNTSQLKTRRATQQSASPVAIEENAVWMQRFIAKMSRSTPEEDAFFAERRRLGRGVGLDKNGKLVRAADLITSTDR